jgi:hypothetical protein
MHIISASRRTDIPHYYADWFRARRLASFAEYRTVYGGGEKGFFRASLKAEDVLGYLFWTKFAGSFHAELARLRAESVPYVFQYTITGYGADIEPRIPRREKAIADFLSVSAALPGPDCIQWRYDPILISGLTYDHAWHRKNFREIARRLTGHARIVNVSFTEPYLKAISKTPAGHIITWRRAAGQKVLSGSRTAREAETMLLRDLGLIAKENGMELRVCCNSEFSEEFPQAQCCGAELFAPYGQVLNLRIAALKPGPSREGCRCLKTVDIGMDNTCPGGCFYCYVTSSAGLAGENFKRHDPASPHLR